MQGEVSGARALLCSGIVIVDRDRLVIFDVDLVVLAHCLDCLDEVGRYLRGESHEQVVLVGDDATLNSGYQLMV